MRDIKFRYVWKNRTTNKMTIIVFDLQEIYSGNAVNDFDYDWKVKYELVSVDQCVGLTDKKGGQVYERDFVLIDGDERKFRIKWFDDMCFGFSDARNDYIKTSYECYDTMHGFPTDDMIEIIGNTYENPELLTDTGA